MNGLEFAAIIVTYNRKCLLERCIECILKQSLKPKDIYVIDNASIDNTYEYLCEKGYLNEGKYNIIYRRLEKNEGGAGGFYYGLKIAYESNLYNGFVLMDDDGMPDIDCFKNLVKHTDKYHYINALVVNETDNNKLSFPRGNSGYDRYKIEEESNSSGIIENYASPFNGTYFSKELVSKVGYPNPYFFFQGDEMNYHKRALKFGYIPVTSIYAIHYHPTKISTIYKFGLGRFSIKLSPENSPLRIYCKHRNLVYNRFSFRDYIYIIISYFLYSYIYLFKLKSLYKYKIFNKAVYAGLTRKMNGHHEYIC